MKFFATRWTLIAVAWGVWLSGGLPLLHGQESEPDTDAERQRVEKWYKAYDEIADSFRVQLDFRPEQDVSLRRETVLTVYNPEFSMRHGRIYLWTDRGRPTLIGSVMSGITQSDTDIRAVNYEFHSLSQRPISVAGEDTVFWDCQEPGIDWSRLSTGSSPAASRAIRLTQMRMIARRYTVRSPTTIFRLMPQPIYRYPEGTQDVTDGAIFSFALSTDPCVYLLIETADDAWSIAFARSNRNALSVRDERSEVWSVESVINQNSFQTGPFYLLWFAERRQADDPDQVLTTAWGN